MITITSRAVSEIKHLMEQRSASSHSGLRLAVVPGGCAGWQYEMKIAEPESGDEVVEEGGARVIVAKESQRLLRGCEIDYLDDLSDSGFRVQNPQAARSCGCGTSFESLATPSSQAPAADGDVCGTH
jgi:iron-sulfur cluster assembly accessory protein